MKKGLLEIPEKSDIYQSIKVKATLTKTVLTGTFIQPTDLSKYKQEVAWD